MALPVNYVVPEVFSDCHKGGASWEAGTELLVQREDHDWIGHREKKSWEGQMMAGGAVSEKEKGFAIPPPI